MQKKVTNKMLEIYKKGYKSGSEEIIRIDCTSCIHACFDQMADYTNRYYCKRLLAFVASKDFYCALYEDK